MAQIKPKLAEPYIATHVVNKPHKLIAIGDDRKATKEILESRLRSWDNRGIPEQIGMRPIIVHCAI